jgi:hypothetical protein
MKFKSIKAGDVLCCIDDSFVPIFKVDSVLDGGAYVRIFNGQSPTTPHWVSETEWKDKSKIFSESMKIQPYPDLYEKYFNNIFNSPER